MDRKKPGYRAYLLRLWCTEQAGVRIWRASLEPPGTDERLGFARLDELFAYIREQTETVSKDTPPPVGGFFLLHLDL